MAPVQAVYSNQVLGIIDSAKQAVGWVTYRRNCKHATRVLSLL